MEIIVALDGPKRRDIELYAGDHVTFSITVYREDGDEAPVEITDPRILTWDGDPYSTIDLNYSYTVPVKSCPRRPYRLVAEVDGFTTTLATGTVVTHSGCLNAGAAASVGYGWWGGSWWGGYGSA